MKTYIRRRDKNRELVVIYGAWGTDENVFSNLWNDDKFDFILFYNYSADEPLVLPEIKTYDKVTVIGWAFGVWAAEYLLPRTGIKPTLTIAVNGTPLPSHDQYGIPLNLIEGTLNNLTEENISKFHLRMFGDKRSYCDNFNRIPNRSIKSLHDELRWLYNRIMEQREPGFTWDYAVSSEIDRVYPAERLKLYWDTRKETKHIILPLPHYFFHKWKTLDEFIAFSENYNSLSEKQKSKKILEITGL
ncbi:MAG TPA: pimeloyl-ACP methyl esterase BioG family protein [Bacteroidales bacterium]|nr:pimeloyl-ACP methyl esterase BioG family protein [Bacteroidales bacterium]